MAKLTTYQQERAKAEVVKLGENERKGGPETVDSRMLLMSVKSEDFWGEVPSGEHLSLWGNSVGKPNLEFHGTEL